MCHTISIVGSARPAVRSLFSNIIHVLQCDRSIIMNNKQIFKLNFAKYR